jgi:hypothetical protein
LLNSVKTCDGDVWRLGMLDAGEIRGSEIRSAADG